MLFCDNCAHSIESKSESCDKCRYAHMDVEEILNRQCGGRKAKEIEREEEQDVYHILLLSP